MPRSEKLKMLEDLVATTHFSNDEVVALQTMFNSIQSGEKMDRLSFRELLHDHFNLTDDLLMDRIFKAFAILNETTISMSEFVRGMSVFLRGSQDELVEFVFGIYSLHGEEEISREEMFRLLKSCIVKPQSEEDRDEGIKDLVDLLMKKMDKDGNGRLSLEDYKLSVKEDSLLLEALGPCLPDAKSAKRFIEAAEAMPRV